MEIAIETLSPTSRVWVYQAKREITTEEQRVINTLLHNFIQQWESHGATVAANFEIRQNQFIILVVSESTSVSGCSIDSSVAIIRQIEEQFNLGLLDHTKVSFEQNNSIKVIPFNQVKSHVKSGEISSDTIIFNNTVTSLEELSSTWKQKAENSWVSRFL